MGGIRAYNVYFKKYTSNKKIIVSLKQLTGITPSIIEISPELTKIFCVENKKYFIYLNLIKLPNKNNFDRYQNYDYAYCASIETNAPKPSFFEYSILWDMVKNKNGVLLPIIEFPYWAGYSWNDYKKNNYKSKFLEFFKKIISMLIL